MALSPYQSMLVANDCVRFVTGSNRPLNPTESLSRYGVNTLEQCALIRHNICSHGTIGVQRFQHSLNPAFLATLSKDWTFAQLAGTIRRFSQQNVPAFALNQPNFSDSEKTEIARRKVAEAMELLESIPKSSVKPKVRTAAFKGITGAKLSAHFSVSKHVSGGDLDHESN